MEHDEEGAEEAKARWLAAEAAYQEAAARYEAAPPGERDALATECALLLVLANEAEQDYLTALRLTDGRSRA